MPAPLLRDIAHRHGSCTNDVLDDARRVEDLGEDFGANLTEREVRYLQHDEWARTADDILWRRTKCGLSMTARERERVAEFVGR